MNKSLLKKISWILVSFLLTLTSVNKTHASHAMGADLTYECLGGNTYKLRLSFYRDCIGINAPTNVFINITSQSCGQSLGVTCYPIPGTGQEVTPICPSALSTCNGGNFTGIQEYIYEGIITLPMQCPDWHFSYDLCCRNAAITTITTPGTSTFHIFADLNNTISPCNSSPTFSNKPVPFICLGQQFCFNHGAFDPDGDSLVYSLITPLQTASSTVNYIGAYNAANPLNSSPPVQFNTQTGDICMTPQQLQVTVMAVLVQEYRNGVLIGAVERDIQITVINCTNTLPTLSGINGTNDYTATICANQQFCFNIFSNDIDAGQNIFVSWDGGIPAATFSTNAAQHPTGTFCWTPTDAEIGGTYCFTATVHDDACPYIGTQIYSYCITVIGLQADAGPDQSIACNDFATVYASASGGSGTYTYQWSTGATSTGITVGPGTYILTASDGQCTDTDTVQIISAFEPTAAFTAVTGCVNQPVQFFDQSTLPGGTIVSWTWYFGDNTTSTLQNPVHQYATAGTYNVQLIVVTSFGCIDTVTQPITVNPIPVAGFTYPNVCAGTTVTFNNTTTPPGINYNWNFGNGQTSTGTNPTVIYNTPGTYTVTLIAVDSSGCGDTITQQITVFPLPTAAFTFSGSGTCQNSTITFTNTSTGGITYNWNFGNGQTSTQQNPVITYNQPGNYDVTLIVTNSDGCVDTLMQTIVIYPLPVVSAGPDQSVCLGSNATLTAVGNGTYIWSTGATTSTVTVSPTVTTTYTVTITDAYGCTGTDQITITVNNPPTPVTSPDQTICLGQSATLSASGGLTYFWNPTGSNTPTITVTPTTSTTYAVNITDANGCTGTGYINVIVRPLPVLNLQNGFVCAGSTTVLDAGNPGSTYLWTPSGQNTQTITISAPGTYGVTVTNAFGCSATDSSVINLGGTITNTLTNVEFCQGGSGILDAGNPGNTYLWSNGQTTQTITVTTAGSYSVVITDVNGCSGTVATTVNVHPLPQADFTPNDACINQPINFLDISTVNGSTITGWFWDFGDGNVSQQQNPTHQYVNNGTHTITLIVTTSTGCTDTMTKSVTVYPLPQANFASDKECEGQIVDFTDMSFTNFGNIISWDWDFGDGNISTQQNPSHQYLTPGTYTVTLTVTTVGGCTDTRPRQLIIYPLPDLDFTVTNTCAGGSISITNNSTTTNGAINSWLWNFGNTNTSTQHTPPDQVYTTPGTYTITLIASTSHGCTDTLAVPVTIYALPTANAGPDQSVCVGASATLTASGGGSYLWDNGATTASITVNPAITTNYGVTVTNANGCTDTDSVQVIVKSLPLANAGADQSICTGGSVTLTATGGVSYTWTPVGSTSASITVNPSVNTTYTVTVTGANGCTATDAVTVSINPPPPANAGPDQVICNGATVGLNGTGGVLYQWSNGGTGSTIYVNPASNSNYIVTVTDANGCTNRDTVNVTVNPTPVVNLAPAFICAGNNVVFDAGNAGSTYLWSPGGETTQSITVTQAGTYNVVVTSPNGCQGSGSTTVTVGGTGIVGNLGNESFCAGGTATLDAGNAGSTYLWSTGSTAQTINVNAAGTYTVTVTDPTGCTGTYAANVTVNPLPVSSFTMSPTCFGSTATFTNTSAISAGNIIQYNWSFGDGNISTAQNPSNLYATPGNYTVSLIATSGNGCVDTVSQLINISPAPVADFGSNTVCYGNSTLFTDLSNITNGSISLWNWNFGNGITSILQNPSYTYPNAGTYNVTLIVASGSGCSDTVTRSVTVNPAPVADFTNNSVCKNTATDFTNLSGINNGVIDFYAWNFGDGNTSTLQNPSHTYLTDGSFTTTLVVTSDLGCNDTMTKLVIVHPLPVMSFNAPPACLDNATLFNDGSTVNSGSINGWYWEFGDGISSNNQNPSHVYNTDGSFSVMLVATTNNGCSDSLVQSVIVYPLPATNFGSSNVCLNNVTQFADSTTISSGSISSYNWIFGDGSSSSSQNPSHNYTSPGTYSVSLITSSNFGCADTFTQSINVFALPVVQFSSGDVCFGLGTAFYNQTTINGGGIANCVWNFGDGSTDTTQNPVHAYGAPGIYNVSLTATTIAGCTGSITQAVEVFENPVAHFNGTDVCIDNPTIFTDGSYMPGNNGIIVTWAWTFGDGGTSPSKNPIHIYTNPGTYNVGLTVTSDKGCEDAFDDSVRVFISPTPAISLSNGCITDPVTFVNTDDPTNASGSTFLWSFGDGNTSSAASPTHLYTLPGTYNVTLEVTNQSSCKTSVTTPIVIHPLPDPGFNAGDACANETIQFQNTSTISAGTITGYQWIFGDGTTSTLENPSHAFSTPGTYTVTLIAVSNYGCIDSVSMTITIFALPTTQFTAMNSEGCGPLPVQFTDQSFISSGNIVGWSWNFGDGGTDSTQNPVHIYTASGNYTVTLTVTSNNGCQTTYSINNLVTVYPQPVAEFTPSPNNETTTESPYFEFDNQSTGSTVQYWDFGDGHVSTAENPSHAYADSGTFVVTLMVQNQYGCVDTISKIVKIIPITTIFVPNAFSPNNDGANEVFTLKGYNITDIQFTIWNRWGESVFTTTDGFNHPWDGSIDFSNEVAKEDVYVYVAVVKDVFGQTHHRKGRVTLVR